LSGVLAPSDVARLERGAAPRPVRVGGRIAQIEKRTLRIADALGSVEVALAKSEVLSVGDLVLVAGTLSKRGRLRDGRVLDRVAHEPPRGDGDVARFAWHGVGPRLALRARAFATIRDYFAREAFIEVDTPALVPTPGLDLHVDAFRAEGGHLVTSPEFQMKRLLAGGLPRIYQLAHCFRAGELGTLHEPEFAMLEWYRAFAGQDEVMADTEHLVEQVVNALVGKPRVTLPSGKRVDVRPPFERVSVRQAFREHAGIADAVDLAESDADRFFELLVGKVEPGLAGAGRPIFLCEYPLSQASLARPKPSDGSVAERFELYVGGVELCNGFSELTDPTEQRLRFGNDRRARRRARRPVYPLDERFLAALEEGMPPAGGNALGVDRLVALACGVSEIAQVQAFPRSVL